MKVVQISTWNTPCGIAGYTKGLMKGMLENGIDCDILEIERQKLNYMTQNELKNYFDEYIQKISDYDIIHIQHEFSFFAGSYAFNTSISTFHHLLKKIVKLRKPIFVTFHSEPSFLQASSSSIVGLVKQKLLKYNWQLQVASLFSLKNNLHTIVHTKNSRRDFLDSGFDKKAVHILRQGVTFSSENTKISEIDKKNQKEKLGFPSNSIILAMFGFISSYKGYVTAVQALRYLPEKYHLLIIGMPHPYSNDDALNDIIRLLKRYEDLKDRVRLTGYVEFKDLKDYYSIVDFNLAPYKPGTQLSSSAAITWALSSGKPVIASRIRAFAELNEDANCLHLVTPGNAGELAYQIQKLAEDDELQSEIVSNALKYCETNQWSKIAKEHIEMYKKFMQSSHPK